MEEAFLEFKRKVNAYIAPRRIDVHSHITPSFYKEWLNTKRVTTGGIAIPIWNEEEHLEFMNKLDIKTSILSISSPGVVFFQDGFDDIDWDDAKKMARRLNEYCAKMCKDYPSRFGFLGTLLLPDVDSSIEEAKYVLETLNADGIVLPSNIGNYYVGDAHHELLMDYLDTQKAVVFIHPDELPCDSIKGIDPFSLDFLLGVVRAAVNICKNGWHEKYPNIKFILSYGGGFIPYAACRIATVAGDGDRDLGMERLGRFYFDLTSSCTSYSMLSLLEFADEDKLLFGSDYPYVDVEETAESVAFITDDRRLSPKYKFNINRMNALELFPRFKEYSE